MFQFLWESDLWQFSNWLQLAPRCRLLFIAQLSPLSLPSFLSNLESLSFLQKFQFWVLSWCWNGILVWCRKKANWPATLYCSTITSLPAYLLAQFTIFFCKTDNFECCPVVEMKFLYVAEIRQIDRLLFIGQHHPSPCLPQFRLPSSSAKFSILSVVLMLEWNSCMLRRKGMVVQLSPLPAFNTNSDYEPYLLLQKF